MANAGLTYEQLETAFRHRNFKPLYFFYGEETFLIDELEALLVERALAPHERDFNLDVVYGAEHEGGAALALCAGYPVMAERRVVIIRDFEKLKEHRPFAAYAERPNPSAVVVLACRQKPNLSMQPYRALKKHAAWAELKPLYANQMPGWITKRAKAEGLRIEPQAASMLAEQVGTSLQAAAAEIEKLATYAGERAAITAEDVLRAGGQSREVNVFELQRAVGEGRYPDALRIADQMLQQASNPRSEALMIVSVLTSYFTKLWKLTTCQAERLPDKAAAARVGVSPFFIKEYLFSLRRFSPAAIERAFSALLAADYELKGGAGRSEPLVLTLLLRRITPEADPARRPAAA